MSYVITAAAAAAAAVDVVVLRTVVDEDVLVHWMSLQLIFRHVTKPVNHQHHDTNIIDDSTSTRYSTPHGGATYWTSVSGERDEGNDGIPSNSKPTGVNGFMKIDS